jgi:hypothetical protein
MMTDPALWARLDALDLDDPSAALPFTARLAKENGWTRAHACRVVHEYKRFVYLSQLGKGMVTPSDAVDRAWHLHLTYTRHYWDTLCGETLGQPLHHEPTRGGAAEDARYRAGYQRTLALYATEVGAAPPSDVWPRPPTRVDQARLEVGVPRNGARLAAAVCRVARLALVATAVLIGFASLALAASDRFGNFIGTLAILAVVIVAVVSFITLVLRRFARYGARRRNDGGSGSGCGGGGGSGGSCSSSDGGGGGGGGCGGGGGD